VVPVYARDEVSARHLEHRRAPPVGAKQATPAEVGNLRFAGRSVELGPTAFMAQLRTMAPDGALPPWSRWFSDDIMRELVHDENLRVALEREMPRLPLSYAESAVPVPDAWLRRSFVILRGAGGRRESAATRA
jgi:hypothetical protein